MNAGTAATRHAPISHRSVLGIAIPVVISNVSTPLIGVVDTAVVGRLPDPAYIGAVAIGSLIFTFLFWAFGFLRMGTTGLTAQAHGANDADETLASLGRALLIALAVGVALIILQWPLQKLAFALLEGSARVETLGQQYFDIRIWAAPATLANYALLGWFIGLGRTDIALVLQLILNIGNMVLDVLFVLGFGWGVQGVAAGTVIAEVIAAAIGVLIALRHARHLRGRWRRSALFDTARLSRTLLVNRDIMIRSLALIFVFVWFTANGAKFGDAPLAANAILMQFIAVSAYFLDGLAFAAESLIGRAIGAANRTALIAAMRITTTWAVGFAVVAAIMIALLGPSVIDLLTVDSTTRTLAREYLIWAALSPVLGVWAFQLDGFFIGATLTAQMRSAMLLSLAIFLAAWWLLTPLRNHGLWLSLLVHYLARIGTLAFYLPTLLTFSAPRTAVAGAPET
jgi:MATE family multidrug resistance protein